jgi:hypothetical protein
MSAAATIVNPNTIKSRDLLVVALINGSVKSGYQKNHKHDNNKKACRKFRADRWE